MQSLFKPLANDPAIHRLKFTGNCTRLAFDQTCRAQETWYHSYYFDNGFEKPGDWNIGKDIRGYGFPPNMSGMRVLDIGTGGGWFAFYFEQAGADVTTIDARGYCDFDVYGRFTYPPAQSEKSAPDRFSPEGRSIYYSPVSGAFWVIHDLLGSQIRYVNSRVYDIRPELFENQTFDLVFMGALLLHLRDPIGALMAARSVCRDRIITTTLAIEEDIDNPHPMMDLPYTHLDKISWWRPNKACYKHWLRAAGFEGDVNVERTVPLTGDVPRQRLQSENANDLINKTTILRIGEARIG